MDIAKKSSLVHPGSTPNELATVSYGGGDSLTPNERAKTFQGGYGSNTSTPNASEKGLEKSGQGYKSTL